MALIATSTGWQKNPETGQEEFVVRLVASDPQDVPGLTAGDIWNRTPLRLERATANDLARELKGEK